MMIEAAALVKDGATIEDAVRKARRNHPVIPREHGKTAGAAQRVFDGDNAPSEGETAPETPSTQEPIPMSVLLNRWMNARSVTIKELAENIGVSDQSIMNWRNGKYSVQRSKMERLANYFGVSIPEFMAGPPMEPAA
jgi:DNA-binding XRE family transcriptional regulator